MELQRPRAFGDCWLGCELWRQLGLDGVLGARLAQKVQREVSWEKVLGLLVVNRLLDPGSEFRLHRQWFLAQRDGRSCWAADFAVADKDRLYRCLDRCWRTRQTCSCI